MPHHLPASQYAVMILSVAAAILNTVIIVPLPERNSERSDVGRKAATRHPYFTAAASAGGLS